MHCRLQRSPLGIAVTAVLLMVALAAAAEQWEPFFSEPTWVVLHTNASNLPSQIQLQPSNNCVGSIIFEGRLFLAWRTAPTHFASAKTHHYIVSSPDMGRTWEYEHTIYLERDMREPHFIIMNNVLIYSFFSAGTNPLGFDPYQLLRIRRVAQGQWTEPEVWGQPGEIAWQLWSNGSVAYATSYVGNHYEPEKSNILVFFNTSTDGVHWSPVNGTQPVMYEGGVSEVGWTFDADGNVWGVMRNEDGDDTGFGSHVLFAAAGNLGHWDITPVASSPWIYESPRMFAHAGELFLVARTDFDGPFDRGYKWLPFAVQKERNLAEYSLRPHGTAVWRLDRSTRTLELVQILPGDGDTAFPSIVQIDEHRFLIWNYSRCALEAGAVDVRAAAVADGAGSPLNHPTWSWLEGQTSPEGTGIYYVVVEFVPSV